jgi:hypothetical protein
MPASSRLADAINYFSNNPPDTFGDDIEFASPTRAAGPRGW